MSNPNQTFTQIHVEGDPTVWTLSEPTKLETIESGNPAELPVVSPLAGLLLLSAEASFTLLPEPLPQPRGWIPGDVPIIPAGPYLYLPSVSTPTAGPVYYQLSFKAEGNVLAAIKTAMEKRTTRKVIPMGDGGAVVINGATLPFAVIGG